MWYFAAMGITVRRGRDFDRHDDKAHPSVAIVSEAFARKCRQLTVGKRLGPRGLDVTNDRRWRRRRRAAQPEHRRALAPVVRRRCPGVMGHDDAHCRTGRVSPLAVTADVQRSGSGRSTLGWRPATSRRSSGCCGVVAVARQRITAGMLTVFAGIALLLAVVAFTASSRTP